MSDEEWEDWTSELSRVRRARFSHLWWTRIAATATVIAALWIIFVHGTGFDASSATVLLVLFSFATACIGCAFKLIACIDQLFPLQQAIKSKNENQLRARKSKLYCPITFQPKIARAVTKLIAQLGRGDDPDQGN